MAGSGQRESGVVIRRLLAIFVQLAVHISLLDKWLAHFFLAQ